MMDDGDDDDDDDDDDDGWDHSGNVQNGVWRTMLGPSGGLKNHGGNPVVR